MGTVQEIKGCEVAVVLYLNPVEKRLQEIGHIAENVPSNQAGNRTLLQRFQHQTANLLTLPNWMRTLVPGLASHNTHEDEENLIPNQPGHDTGLQRFLQPVNSLTKKWWCWLVMFVMIAIVTASIVCGILWLPSPTPQPSTTPAPRNVTTTLTTVTTETTTTPSSSSTVTSPRPNTTTPSPDIDPVVVPVSITGSILALFLIAAGFVFFCRRISKAKEEVLRTLPYYLALSRSTAEVHILDIPVTSTGDEV